MRRSRGRERGVLVLVRDLTRRDPDPVSGILRNEGGGTPWGSVEGLVGGPDTCAASRPPPHTPPTVADPAPLLAPRIPRISLRHNEKRVEGSEGGYGESLHFYLDY